MPAVPTFKQLIEDEIKQLRELEKMAENPRMVELMRRLVFNSSNGTSANAPSQPQGAVKPPAKPVTKFASNGLSMAVLDAVRARTSGPFTVYDIVGDLSGSGFQFVAKTPRVAVHSVIERLLKKGVLTLVDRGHGNNPHKYHYVSG